MHFKEVVKATQPVLVVNNEIQPQTLSPNHFVTAKTRTRHSAHKSISQLFFNETRWCCRPLKGVPMRICVGGTARCNAGNDDEQGHRRE
jgi:hypothetical protein